MVVETLLRLKFNLVIPASFLDIENPPEKKLFDAVARRGIYISQHHVEPLGLSHFAFEDFAALSSSVDAEREKFTRATFWLYTKSLHSFYLWFISLFEAKTAYHLKKAKEAENDLKRACLSLEDYLDARTLSEYGSFKNRYRGENKMNVRERLLCTRELLDKVIKAK